MNKSLESPEYHHPNSFFQFLIFPSSHFHMQTYLKHSCNYSAKNNFIFLYLSVKYHPGFFVFIIGAEFSVGLWCPRLLKLPLLLDVSIIT